ncbi:uncharacterized protein LOC144916374 [Branchiostoma floridae x Branchiostoma belcheri]
MRRVHSGSGLLQRRLLWAPLHNLKSFMLVIDEARASDFYFGPVFRNMSKLETIEISSSYFGYPMINVEMLRPLLKTLKHLHTNARISPGLLKSLTHLQTLNLDHNLYPNIADYLPEFRHTQSDLSEPRHTQNLLSELRHTQIHELSLNLWNLHTIAPDTLAGIKGLNLLKTLLYDQNSIEVIQANAFAGLSDLQRLDVTRGDNNWQQKTLTLHDKAFSGLPSLTHLNLTNNIISTLPQNVFYGLSSLTHLKLTNNKISNLPEYVFYGLSSLTHLDLAGNKVSTLPQYVFEGLHSFTHLDLSHNVYSNSETLQAYLPETMDYLSLSHNKLHSTRASILSCYTVNLFDLKSVNHLDLRYNELKIVDIDCIAIGVQNITVLDLQHNKIVTLRNA